MADHSFGRGRRSRNKVPAIAGEVTPTSVHGSTHTVLAGSLGLYDPQDHA